MEDLFLSGQQFGLYERPELGVIGRFSAKRVKNDSAAREFCGDFIGQNPWNGASDIEERMV